MPLKVVRNDITRMMTEAIVNTAGEQVGYGAGCDTAIHRAAGAEKLLRYRKEHVGSVPEGEVFLTPGFDLPAKYIIHAVSPLFVDGAHGEEEKLRNCYRKSLELAVREGISSVSFPLIATGSFGYPRAEGFAIAVEEIRNFLQDHDILVYLVVFGEADTGLGRKIYPQLLSYIDDHYVMEKQEEEYGAFMEQEISERNFTAFSLPHPEMTRPMMASPMMARPAAGRSAQKTEAAFFDECVGLNLGGIDERMEHLSDTFSEYLFFLIEQKGLKNADVWRDGLVDRKTFSKIKNNPDYHPQKITALCLCVGAKLNLDEAKDLLARAGYAFSPCDKTDIIFSFFIENEIYDMVEVDIQLEEHGLPCLIS